MDEHVGNPEALANVLAETGRTCMPFGKYGPEHYPPAGVPLCDLPYEYLAWFVRKGGFPRGKLGKLLEFVHQAKQDGADELFEPVRTLNGGRTRLRVTKQKSWSFDGD
ncbi:MAG: DUF3820 family protein [Lentisphaeria bacterium]|nr:DUF3820 family protein [Lentisphaeria bacterium]